MTRPLWSLLFLLSCTGAFPTDKCMIENKRCDIHDDNLVTTNFGLTYQECYELCRNEINCSAYSYFGPNSSPFRNQCMLFSYCDVLNDCEDCITASVRLDCSTCGISYEGIVDNENFVRYEVGVPTEPECRRLCSDDISCNVYTYYSDQHPTDRQLCILLKEIQKPVTRCEGCQTAPQTCQEFSECSLGFYQDGEGNMISSPKGLLVTESNECVMRFISGETGCYKNITALAVGSGGSGGHYSSGGAGGGSGHINTTQLSIPANTAITVEIDMSGTSTAVIVESTGEVLLSAANGKTGPNWATGGDGYCGGGGSGMGAAAGGDGGSDGADGENGDYFNYAGGSGSGFTFNNVNLQHYHLTAGKGGKHSSGYAGGGAGVLVDGAGPAAGDRVGEGYGGGGPGDGISTVRSGSPGCVILEI